MQQGTQYSSQDNLCSTWIDETTCHRLAQKAEGYMPGLAEQKPTQDRRTNWEHATSG